MQEGKELFQLLQIYQWLWMIALSLSGESRNRCFPGLFSSATVDFERHELYAHIFGRSLLVWIHFKRALLNKY
jgi:hypothetical protein